MYTHLLYYYCVNDINIKINNQPSLLPYVHVNTSQGWYMIHTVSVTDDKIHSHSL